MCNENRHAYLGIFEPIVVKIIFNYGILRFLTGSGIATALNLTIERVAYTVG